MRIDIITERRRSYSFESYASERLTHALGENKIKVHSIAMEDGNFADYLLSLGNAPPNATIAFKDLFSLTSFWSRFEIPHLLWTRHSLVRAFPFFDVPFHTVGCNDKMSANKFNLWFLPPAMDQPQVDQNTDRPFDVVHFADLIDLKRKEEMWREIFPEEELRQLHEALSRCVTNCSLHPIEVTKNVQHAHEIEEYLRAQTTLFLIESIEDFKLHLFGNHVGNNWLKRINREKIALHAALPYAEACAVLRRSKIYLTNSHEIDPWFFPALQAGALPLSQISKEKIVYFLNHPQIRREKVNALFQQLYPGSSWKERASDIIEWAKKNP